MHRDDVCVSFMSINPLAEGHVLVVPRAEVDQWTDLSADVCAHLMSLSRAIGRAQKSAFGCPRAGLIIAGFEVPHCHVHVIPTRTIEDLSFENARSSVSPAELESAAARIRARLTVEGVRPVDA